MQSFDLDKTDILKIKQALEGSDENLLILLEEYHASEIAILFESISLEDQKTIIHLLPAELASEIISEMSHEAHPEELLIEIDSEKRQDIIEELDYDDATDIISQMGVEDQHEILSEMDKEHAVNIRNLMTYPEDTAGGLMNTQVIKVNAEMSKKQAIDEIILQSEEIEEFYTIYVVAADDVLQGIVSLKDIIKAKANAKVADLVNADFVYVRVDVDQEEVADLISQYNLTSIPVVDINMRLLGRVTFDDVIDVMQEENTEDMLKISGVSEDEELSGNWIEAVKSRLPWLILNLGTAFLASSVIRYFEPTVTRIVVLAGYMTIIAGMGGNAATQALAVTVRRITLSDLSDQQAYRTVIKELTVGFINGAVNGLIVFLFAFFYDDSPMLGLVIFMAMTGNLVIAGITGAGIPLILKRVGIDPAIASSIIITTFTDVFGFLLLLGLASKLLL
ncbi:MAG: magnesium transporter [Bacteroidetes bacterium]|nr:magnesium transporter [Bacteroidota bacterium]MBU1372289.1 magnesium transporter [Bacteroidota bacterium]MBU1486052.1 magnesium transporter [Bacteroidota bacterium]MBU1759484.1 magnesium transporter [Bacteroidota bacterium]MBU2268343.1 magnesium transporter [Bacteroidota bacterium]